MDKLHSYQGMTGRIHEVRDDLRTNYTNWRDQHPGSFIQLVKNAVYTEPGDGKDTDIGSSKEIDFSNIYR